MRYSRGAILRVLVAAALGVACTYAVAWRGCIVAAEQSRQGALVTTIAPILATDEEFAWWVAHAPADAGEPGSKRAEIGPGCELCTLYALPREPGSIASAHITRAGWPAFTVEGIEIRIPARPGWRFERSGWFDMVILRPFGLRGLPLRPILPAFLWVSALYAVVAWLLLTTPGVVVQAIRRHRHQCPACGYPRGGSAICTECGHALIARR